MKYSLNIYNFLEEISSPYHPIVFLYFFALISRVECLTLFFLRIFGDHINEKEVSREAVRHARCVSESGLMGEGVRQ